MKLCISIYEGVNLLDVAGPLEMFYWAGRNNRLETKLISSDGSSVTSINGVKFEAQASFAEASELDILWVPGGDPKALVEIMRNENSDYLVYLRQVAKDATWVCFVCEGALLLARSGLLDGHLVTTHWQFVKCLEKFPNIKVVSNRERFLFSGNRLTGGGVSAGIDESLALIAKLFGKESADWVQKVTEYFPMPPVDAKLPDGAPACSISWD